MISPLFAAILGGWEIAMILAVVFAMAVTAAVVIVVATAVKSRKSRNDPAPPKRPLSEAKRPGA